MLDRSSTLGAGWTSISWRSSRCAGRSPGCARRRRTPALIEEYETEYRNLSSLYRAATDTFDADQTEPRLPDALASLGFGDWTLTNVYSFVYDASMELPVDDGRELARRIDETDYAASLLAVLDAD